MGKSSKFVLRVMRKSKKKAGQYMAGMILQTDLTRAQLLGEALQNARGKKKFVLGEPLIWPELLSFLPTRMTEFHKWYAVS